MVNTSIRLGVALAILCNVAVVTATENPLSFDTTGGTANDTGFLGMLEEENNFDHRSSITERKKCPATRQCTKAGGSCIMPKAFCDGKVVPKGCKGKGCKCCIPDHTTPAPSTCPTCPAPTTCPTCPAPSTCPTTPALSTCPVQSTCPTYPAPSTCPTCPAPSTCPTCPAPSTCPTCPAPSTCPTCPAPSTCQACPTTTGPRECVGSAVAFGTQCLTFFSAEEDRLTPAAATAACVANGGRLATINHPQDVYDYANANYPPWTGFWVGGSDADVEGTWLWSSWRPFDDQVPWRSGEPNNAGNEDCVAIATGSGYVDYPCSYINRYICEAGPF